MAQLVKNLPTNAGDVGSILGSGRSPEKEIATTPVTLPGESYGEKSLVGYRPLGHKS